MTTRLGFIGLGNLGIHLAGNLLRAGFPLTVYDSKSACSRTIVGCRRNLGGLATTGRCRGHDRLYLFAVFARGGCRRQWGAGGSGRVADRRHVDRHEHQ